MTLANTLNPFFFQDDQPALYDKDTHALLRVPATTLYSAIDLVQLSGLHGLEKYCTYVPPENDLTIYGLDVELSTDLINHGRAIRIFCRTLKVMPTADDAAARIIDVSGVSDELYRSPKRPDYPLQSDAPGPAASADEIRAAVAKGGYAEYFATHPGTGWGKPGRPAGSITIACEKLVLAGHLVLRAKGGAGNAGMGGQDRNYVEGAVGGDASSGGSGGSGGNIQVSYQQAVDAQDRGVNPDDYLQFDVGPGEQGADGTAGDAFEREHQAHHYGSEAPAVDEGEKGDWYSDAVPAIKLTDATDPNQSTTVADLSWLALNLPLSYVRLLFQRATLTYLENQPVGFGQLSGPGWTKVLGDVLGWAYRVMLGYGLPGLTLETDLKGDSELADKRTVASSIMVAHDSYLKGQLLWGYSTQWVSPLPFQTQLKMLTSGYTTQKDVRDLYIKLRQQRDKALQSQAALTQLRTDADRAVQLHKQTYEALRDMLVTPATGGGTTLHDQLLAANNEVTAACTALRQKLTEFKVAGQKLWDFSLSDLAEALKSMMFVASDPPALIGMGFLGASSLYDNIFNKIKTNDGQEIAKDKLDKIDTFNGELADLAKVAVPIGSAKDNQLSQIVLTSLDTIDQFVSRFTEALGEAATGVIDDIKDYRDKIDAKNDLMIAYNTQLLQLAKEFDAYQAARDKQIALDQKPDQLTKDMVATTMHYGSVYLAHLLTTANAVSWLRRAYAYTTLGAVPENNYVGDASLFWDDPSQLNDSSLSDQFTVVQNYANDLENYQANQPSLVLIEPSDMAKATARSTYFVLLDGANRAHQPLLRKLLDHRRLTVTVVLPTGATPWPGPIENPVKVSDTSTIQDARVLNVTPWIEGVTTTSKSVHFQIRTGSRALIVDRSQTPQIFDYPSGLTSDFAHSLKATVPGVDNQAMGGAGDGSVASEFVGARGLFTTYKLSLPSTNEIDTNNGLAYDAIENVRLQICFRMALRNKTRT